MKYFKLEEPLAQFESDADGVVIAFTPSQALLDLVEGHWKRMNPSSITFADLLRELKTEGWDWSCFEVVDADETIAFTFLTPTDEAHEMGGYHFTFACPDHLHSAFFSHYMVCTFQGRGILAQLILAHTNLS